MDTIKEIVNIDEMIKYLSSIAEVDSISIETLNQQNKKRNVEIDKPASITDVKQILTEVINDHYKHLPHRKYVAFITLEGQEVDIKLRPMPNSA